MSEEREIQYNPSADLYRLLGVPTSATADTIRQVFRKRAMEVHPDRNPTRQAWATEQFQALNDAYDILGDPALRDEYDKQRYAYLSQAFASPPPSSYVFGSDIFGEASDSSLFRLPTLRNLFDLFLAFCLIILVIFLLSKM